MKKKPNGYWTYERCHEEALKYQSRRAFSIGNQFAYIVACKNKWIGEWFVSATGKKWNEITCREESKQYDTRSEFCKGSNGAWNVARLNGWLETYTWLKDGRLELFKGENDSVYAYEFKDYNAVYIGRTLMRQQKIRDRQHLWKDDAVSKFAKMHNIPVPSMKILEENLTIEQGAKKEGEYVSLYKSKGWNVLNKAKTGAIGSIGKGKWTKETCFEEAKKYTTYKDFREANHQASKLSVDNGWIDDFYWMERTQKPKGYWTRERCFEEAKKYQRINELLEDNETLYRIAYKRGWLQDYTWLTRQVKPRGYWTKERCYEEAQKYSTKRELEKGNGSVYQISRRKGWLKDYVWMIKQNQ